MEANAARHPILVANGIRIADASWQQGFNSWPIGLVQWMIPKSRELDYEEWLRRDAEALAHFTPPPRGRYSEESWEHEVLRQYWFARYTHGVELINYATRHDSDRRAAERAVQTLESVVTAGVFVQPQVYKTLGGAYGVLSVHDSTAHAGMIRSFNRYLELAPEASDRAEVRAMMAQ
jgi:hypothetical protein